MRRLPKRLLLAATAVSALAVGLLAATLLLLLLLRRRRKRPPSLPVTEPPLSKHRFLLRHLLLLIYSRRRRTRVEPTAPAAEAAEKSPAPGPEEDMVEWRELLFGPISWALYTIEEETDAESDDEPETPFYTPPASPAGPGGDSLEADVEASAGNN